MKNKLDKKEANMEKVSLIRYRSAAGVMKNAREASGNKVLAQVLASYKLSGKCEKKNTLLKIFF